MFFENDYCIIKNDGDEFFFERKKKRGTKKFL